MHSLCCITDTVDYVILYGYRVAIVQAVLAALRNLPTKDARAEVAAASGNLAPIISLIYNSLSQHDDLIFYKSRFEKHEEKIIAKPEDHIKDELLIEMRLQDIENVKKLEKEESERKENILKEDLTESENSDSDDSERSEAPEALSDVRDAPKYEEMSPYQQVRSFRNVHENRATNILCTSGVEVESVFQI